MMTRGAISARAEEPAGRMRFASSKGGDLRAGGGTLQAIAATGRKVGRSPRGRRNPRKTFTGSLWRGAISARAEEPVNGQKVLVAYRGDLRAGGGTQTPEQREHNAAGRSPRGRRNHHVHSALEEHGGAISARAEEP